MVNGQKRLLFSIAIPPGQSYPAPFMTSKGSLAYRLVAHIIQDRWNERIAKKLVNFTGYYDVLHMELNPCVQRKSMQTKSGEKITSTFRVPNTVAVMGVDTLEGYLELNGVMENRVNATLTFFRNINYGGKIRTEVVLSQNRHAEIHQDDASFNWKVLVPKMKRISYRHELYSVHYYLKVILPVT